MKSTILFIFFCVGGVWAQAPAKKADVFKVTTPESIAYFGKISSRANKVDKATILNCDTLKVSPCYSSPSTFRVIGFDLTCIIKGGAYVYAVNGAVASSEIKAAINKLVPGSKIFIDRVRISGKNFAEKIVPGITITIIEKLDTALLSYKLAIEEPLLLVNGKRAPDEIPSLKLGSLGKLTVEDPCPYEFMKGNYEVLGFDLRIGSTSPKVYSTKGASLSQEMKAAVKKLNPGKEFCLENIRVKAPNGAIGTLQQHQIKILP